MESESCPKCGSTARRVLKWDGYNRDGNGAACAKCGYVLIAYTGVEHEE